MRLRPKLAAYWPAMTLAALIGFFGTSNADDAKTAAEVRKEMAEAGEAIRNYSADRKDYAVNAAKEVLAKIDKRIDRIEGRIDKAAAEMSQSARARARETLRQLRRKRQEVAEWFGALKHGSTEAWSEIKNGFADAYGDLQDAVTDAEKNKST